MVVPSFIATMYQDVLLYTDHGCHPGRVAMVIGHPQMFAQCAEIFHITFSVVTLMQVLDYEDLNISGIQKFLKLFLQLVNKSKM